MKVIARIQTDFPDKFGIPRQSGLVEALKGRIVFEPEFRNPEAVRGLTEFSHIWLLWSFSENARENWSATVKPPQTGRKKEAGGFCHPFSLQTQWNRSFLCAASGDRDR